MPAKLTRGPYRYYFRSVSGVETEYFDEEQFFRSIWETVHVDKSHALTALGLQGRIETKRGEYVREERAR